MHVCLAAHLLSCSETIFQSNYEVDDVVHVRSVVFGKGFPHDVQVLRKQIRRLLRNGIRSPAVYAKGYNY